MKFADKLFFWVTAVVTIIFTVFGAWMLSSYFQKVLNRELEQGSTESRMFQSLFEITYQSVQEYGASMAVPIVMEEIKKSISKEGNQYFVLDETEQFFYETVPETEGSLKEVLLSLRKEMKTENTYAYQLHEEEGRYYLISLCTGKAGDKTLWLGMSKDLTLIYKDRQSLMIQYRMILVLLVFAGGVCIYLLSRYITRPIQRLERIAVRIAAGNYGLRAKNTSQDEIGELSESFNQMADRLVEQMEEQKKEARQKEDFTAAFAHELKTPLTSIIGYADMLNSVEMTEEERREAYYYIYSQGKRLESLSHKLLDLVSAQKQPMKMVPVLTQELEKGMRSAMRPIWKQKKIKGKIILEKGVIYGDYELLLSLLYNLLDNAMKAVTEEGFILMKGRNLESGYEIKVVDNGRGIPEEEIERITEAFYMVDKSRSRKEGGAGIGMALCKKIVEKHSGRLKIASKPGEGTVVQLLFPNASYWEASGRKRIKAKRKGKTGNEVQ